MTNQAGEGLGRRRPIADTAFARWVKAKGDRKYVADLLGISQSYLEKIAQGRRRPSLELAAKIEMLSRGSAFEVTSVMMNEDHQRISGKAAA